MKKIKILACLLLAVICTFSLVACSNPSLEAYVDEKGDELVEELEKTFSEGGMSSEVSIKADGNTLVVDVAIKGLNNIPDNEKAELQSIFDAGKEEFKASFDGAKEEVADLEAVVFNVREEDNDLLATIDIDL